MRLKFCATLGGGWIKHILHILKIQTPRLLENRKKIALFCVTSTVSLINEVEIPHTFLAPLSLSNPLPAFNTSPPPTPATSHKCIPQPSPSLPTDSRHIDPNQSGVCTPPPTPTPRTPLRPLADIPLFPGSYRESGVRVRFENPSYLFSNPSQASPPPSPSPRFSPVF